jgi:hypothetical protein
MDEFNYIPIKGMGMKAVHPIFKVPKPVQVILDEPLNLFPVRRTVEEGEEIQFKRQMIRGAPEFLRDFQAQLMEYLPHMEGTVSHDKTLGDRKGQRTAGIVRPGFISRFHQGNLLALPTRKKTFIFGL